jgi:arylsulfatase
MVFSADDGLDVGCDTGASVSPDYGPHDNEFNGSIRGVQLAIGEDADKAEHRISPEEALRVAMARQ